MAKRSTKLKSLDGQIYRLLADFLTVNDYKFRERLISLVADAATTHRVRERLNAIYRDELRDRE